MKLGSNFNLKLSIKAICLYEQLSGNSFMDISNISTDEEFVQLLYCVLMAHDENNVRCTFEDFLSKVFPPMAEKLINDFSTEIAVAQQFRPMIESEDNEIINEESESSPKDSKPVYLHRVVPILVKDCGLDINYVMDEMNYADIDIYLNYKVEQDRQEKEDKRFWLYWTIIPHIDGNKVKKPESLFSFSWEKESRRRIAEKGLQDEAVRKKLFESGILKNTEEANQ